jgi:hypothetical protein
MILSEKRNVEELIITAIQTESNLNNELAMSICPHFCQILILTRSDYFFLSIIHPRSPLTLKSQV